MALASLADDPRYLTSEENGDFGARPISLPAKERREAIAAVKTFWKWTTPDLMLQLRLRIVIVISNKDNLLILNDFQRLLGYINWFYLIVTSS